MEPQFRTSFVPKKPVETAGRRTVRRAPLSIFFILGLVVFLASVALSLGAFVYQQYLESSISRKAAELEQARAVFEPALIQELTRLDARLETSKNLLNQHTALTRLFAFLESKTLQNVQFRDFRYSALPDGKIALSMNGRAVSFSSVALQSDVFGNSEFIQSPIFEDLNVDQLGGVVFNVSAFINPALLSYRAAVAARPSEPEEPLGGDSLPDDASSGATTTSGDNSGVGTP